MGIAAGMYMNALNRKIVKCMIEDAVTGFIVYTGMNPAHVEFVTKSGCGGLSNKAKTCYGKTGLTISVSQFKDDMTKSLSQAGQNAVVEIKRKQKSLLNRELARLRTNGRLAGTPNKSGTRATTTARNIRAVERNAKRVTGVKRARNTNSNNGNAAKVPRPTPQMNNAAKRRSNLTAYINALQRNLKNKGVNHNFQKNQWLNQLSKNNTNDGLTNIKRRLKNIHNNLNLSRAFSG